MRESVTYQAILREGGNERVRGIILMLGLSRFGRTSAKDLRIIRIVNDDALLDEVCLRLLTATGWADLLAPMNFARNPNAA